MSSIPLGSSQPSPTEAKEARNTDQLWRATQGARAFGGACLGYLRPRFQRFCRFAAEMHDEKRLLG